MRTDCLCVVNSREITFVYVNDEYFVEGYFDHFRNGLSMTRIERGDPGYLSGHVRLFTKLRKQYTRKQYKGATMRKIAIYAGLFAVLASPLAALATPAAQSSMQAEANAVSITGRVSCSKFGTGSVSARKGMSIAQTIQYCVLFQHGVYTLVSGKQIFGLSGDMNALAKMSGQTVAVAGRIRPDEPADTTYVMMGTVEATTIAPAKN
jgi:hypothetical protein